MSTMPINEQIARFYDECTPVWEKAWSEHIHQGFYGINGDEKKDHRQAQDDLIEAMLKFAQIEVATENSLSLLDIGSGIGGTLFHLAERFQGQLSGVTISASQVSRTQELAQERDLAHRVNIQLGDVLSDDTVLEAHDVVWSIEVCEHLNDKASLFEKKFEATKPGGTMVMATFCHRETLGRALDDREQDLLKKFYKNYHLPYVESLGQYTEYAKKAGFKDVKSEDWTTATEPFLGAILGSMFTPKTLWQVLQSGALLKQGAMGLKTVIQARDLGLLRFGVITGKRPT